MKILSSTVATLLLLVVSGPGAHAGTYHRFWRGTKRADLNWEQFSTSLNQVFIPATVETGAGKGLLAYEPILTEEMGGLPDEVALVTYDSRDAYDALFATDAGKAYQNLHWQIFDRSASHSLTPEGYAGSVAIEQAYDLDPDYTGWKTNITTVLVYFRLAGEPDAAFVSRVAKHLDQALVGDRRIGIQDRTVLVSDRYWIEYVSATAPLTSATGADMVLPVDSESPSQALIQPGRGINLQF